MKRGAASLQGASRAGSMSLDEFQGKEEVLCRPGLATSRQRVRICSYFAEDRMGMGVLAPQSGLSARLQTLQSRVPIILLA
jgi:hypothetical protein